jgi:hypothetical protein
MPSRPLSNSLVNTKLSAAAIAHANGSSSSKIAGKKKTVAGSTVANAASFRARPMSAPVDAQEREEEEWKQEVRFLFSQLHCCVVYYSTCGQIALLSYFSQVAQQLSAVMQALQMVHSSVNALQVCNPTSCQPAVHLTLLLNSYPQHERENDETQEGTGGGLIRGDVDTARPLSAYYA